MLSLAKSQDKAVLERQHVEEFPWGKEIRYDKCQYFKL